jgi:dolichol-phosphate mannosyltransferase
MKVFIIPATYNEKGNIERLITIMEEEVFPKIKNHEMHILVADDNSPDGTADVVRALMKKYKNLNVDVGEKKGLGAAYYRVMSHAIEKDGADVVLGIDADLQHDPVNIPQFIKKIEEGYDIVTGTRYSQGGSMPKNWPIYRKVLSIGANTLVRFITGRFYMHDWTGGFRAYKKEVFLKERDKLRPYSGYTFQVAALYKSLIDGYRIGEVPIHFYSRKIGDSKIATSEYIYNLFKYIIIERFFELERFIKFLFVGGTGFIVQLIFQEGSVILGATHPTGVAIGAETAIISNYLLNNFWTFKDTNQIKQKGNFFIRLIKFNFTSVAAIIIQYLADFIAEIIFGPVLNIFSLRLPTRIVILFPTIILLVIPLNYLIYNKFIWKTQHLKKELRI